MSSFLQRIPDPRSVWWTSAALLLLMASAQQLQSFYTSMTASGCSIDGFCCFHRSIVDVSSPALPVVIDTDSLRRSRKWRNGNLTKTKCSVKLTEGQLVLLESQRTPGLRCSVFTLPPWLRLVTAGRALEIVERIFVFVPAVPEAPPPSTRTRNVSLNDKMIALAGLTQ